MGGRLFELEKELEKELEMEIFFWEKATGSTRRIQAEAKLEVPGALCKIGHTWGVG